MGEGSGDVREVLSYLLEKYVMFGKKRARRITELFESFESFKRYDFESPDSVLGSRRSACFGTQIEKLKDCQDLFNGEMEMNEIWIRCLTRVFVERQKTRIRTMGLDSINMNPFLIKALGMKTPEDVIRFYCYQALGRSIVTSFGFILEDMVIHSGAKKEREWYDAKKEADGNTYRIQLKSGTNDIDKDQMDRFRSKFDKTEKNGQLPRLGFAYGKSGDRDALLHSIKLYLLPPKIRDLIKAHSKQKRLDVKDLDPKQKRLVFKALEDAEKKILIGKDLWYFVSGKENYHLDVLEMISRASEDMDLSLVSEIEARVGTLVGDFKDKYKDSEDPVEACVQGCM